MANARGADVGRWFYGRVMRRTTITLLACVTVALGSAAIAAPASAGSSRHGPPHSSYSWQVTPTGSSDEFRGLAAVSRRVVWVSGEAGTVLRTTDGGATWQDVSPPAAQGEALRDIEATGADHAVVLAIGEGEDSKIYSTDDGGQTWTEVFQNTLPTAFFDCMAFSNDGTGLAMSDPVDGYVRLARTTDWGRTWTLMSTDGMPPALDGEFGFAASGTCIVSGPGHNFWIGTGGDQPRVFHSTDGGLHWTVVDTPVRGGASAGIYSLDFRDPQHGIAVGGDYTDPTNGADAAAYSDDGGRTWQLSTSQVGGYRSGVSFVTGTARTAVAVGPTGSDISFDGGRTWTTFDTARYDGVHCARDGACWASGTDGRVAKLVR